MAIITLPASLPVGYDSEMGAVRSDAVDSSDPSGIEQARIYGPPRWTMTLSSPEYTLTDEAEAWTTLIMRLAGHTNILAAPPVPRQEPRGTMRGTMTLAASVGAGAETAQISAAGQAGTTLLDGDWLQFGAGVGTSQLVRVLGSSTANGSGVISIAFQHRARIAYPFGTAVTWQRPIGYWRRMDAETRWSWTSSLVGNKQALALVEAFQ